MRRKKPNSDHFDGRRFANQAAVHLPTFRDIQRMLRTKRTPWPARVTVQQRAPDARTSTDEVIVTFIGHSTFLVQSADGNVLTDPVYSEHAGPFGIAGPRRVREPAVAFEHLPEISVVLLSHNHYDHCDLNTLRRIAKRFSPLFFTPLGNARLLRRAGARRVEELDWWENSTTSPFPVSLTPAQHFSARTPFDRNRALWGGFVFSVRGRRIFFAGDSGYAPHFIQIRERLGPIDLAILPIAAYEPLVHEADSYEPRGGGACAPRPGRAPEYRLTFRDLSAHRRRDRRTAVRPARRTWLRWPSGDSVPRPRFRRVVQRVGPVCA